MSHWIHNNEKFDLSEQEIKDLGHYGFVYIIHFPKFNRKYIGKKFFWSKKTMPPLKGRKNKRRRIIESNWRTYMSSSDVVKDLIESVGTDDVIFEIVSMHPNKTETNYGELKLQIMKGVLEEKDENGDFLYLNRNISMKFYQSVDYSDHRKLMSEHYSKV